MSRCTGHCCTKIDLPLSPEQLQAALDDKSLQDIETIQPMLINGIQDPLAPEWWVYQCKHWDDRTGNCLIYPNRPKMCSDYGKTYPCSTVGCTWTDAKREIART